jgi:glucose/arabinose dehydrogenase
MVIAQCFSQIILPEKFIVEELPLENLKNPIGIAFSRKDHSFVWEKDGLVWPYHDGQVSTQPLIDIRDEVNNQSDHGLVGFALDPSFLSNGHYYLFYVVDRHHVLFAGTSDYDSDMTITSQASIGRLTRYTADPNTNFATTIEGSRKIIIGESFEDGLPILMTSHAAGSLVFGTDGSLMFTFGDGGSFTEHDAGNANDTYHDQSIADGTLTPEENVGSFRSMMKKSANGKLLRIDPNTGYGLSTNPYFDESDPGSFVSMIWSLGFRNPYKFMKVPNTGSHALEDGDSGTFLLGDVGSSNWEELNLVQSSGNWYGWPFFEGYDLKLPFSSKDVENPEAPNDAFGCDFFTFKELKRNRHELSDYSYVNPCDELLSIDSSYVLIHEPPLLAYSNGQWNPPAKTSVLSFDEELLAVGLSINDPLSEIEGTIMDGASIIPGGYNQFDVYPDEYKGRFFFGDFFGNISTLNLDDEFNIAELTPFATFDKGVTDIKFNPNDGNLYICNLKDKKVYRVSYGGTYPPSIITYQDYIYGASPLNVTFDASESITNSNTPLTWKWMINDEIISNDEILEYTFESNDPIKYEVVLIIEDGEGKTASETYTVSLNNTPPVVSINSMADGDTYSLDGVNTYALRAEVSDLEFEDEDLFYEWHADLHHDDHSHEGPKDNRHETYVFIDPVGCGLEFYRYKVILTVTDPAGLATSDTIDLLPFCGERFGDVIDLNAAVVSKNIKLDWTLEYDNGDVSYFEIEKADDFLFRTIGKVDKNDDDSFGFVDSQPYLGRNLYRLKIYNPNGSYNYSNQVVVEFVNESGFLIYPNPAIDQLSVLSKNENLLETTISVLDISGKLIYQVIVPSKSELVDEKIDVGIWNSGIYYILLSNELVSYQSKFVKL